MSSGHYPVTKTFDTNIETKNVLPTLLDKASFWLESLQTLSLTSIQEQEYP